MKTHTAKVQLLEQFALGKNTGQNSGLEIEIFGKGEDKDSPKLGTIRIGQGTFEWWTKNAKTATKKGTKAPSLSLNWSSFAALMDEQAKK
jgi:hypothetical protein